MERNSVFERYKVSLAGLCYYCARLAHLKQKRFDGVVVTEEEVQSICERIKCGMEDLLNLKDQLGYTDGLEFMEDNLFAGFAIKDGIVSGDLKNLPVIASPWYRNFPEKGNNYQFEVANYLFAYLGEDENISQPVKKSGWFTNLKRRIARRIPPCFNYYHEN